MKIKFLRGIAGQTYSYRKGQEIDLPFNIANKFLSSNNAVVIDDDLPKGLNEPVIKEPIIKTTVIKTKPVVKKKTYKKKK